jgi:hypothetical protein
MNVTTQTDNWLVNAAASTALLIVDGLTLQTAPGSFPCRLVRLTTNSFGFPIALTAALGFGGFPGDPRHNDGGATVTFASASITEQEPGVWTIAGQLSAQDATSTVCVTARVEASRPRTVLVNATARLGGFTAGLADGLTFLAGGDIEVDLAVTLQLEQGPYA